MNIDDLHLLLLNIGLADHHADWNWKNVSSPFARIFYALEGSATLHMPKGDFSLLPGHMYMVPPFVTHSYTCRAHFRHFYLHIYSDSAPHASLFEQYDFPVEIPAAPLDRPLIERLAALNPTMRIADFDPVSYDNRATLASSIVRNKNRRMAVRIESRGILYLLVSRFVERASEKKVADDPRIQRTVNMINSDIRRTFSLDDLVSEALMSKDHFVRLFKKETGLTPIHYINLKKMQHACLMLLTANDPVKNVAYALGFDDQSYFTRLFRKEMGVSPMEYRRSRCDSSFI